MRALRVFSFGLLVGWRDLAVFWNWKTWTLGWILRVCAVAGSWILLGKLLQSEELIEFLLIGNAIAAGASAAAWAIPASTWDRVDGTYPLLLISPGSIFPAIVGRTAVWMVNGVLTSVVAFCVLSFAFDYSIEHASYWEVGLTIITVCTSTYCFAVFLGAWITLLPKLRNVALGLVATAITTVCGVSVPISFWPSPVQVVAFALPVTNGLEGFRALVSNDMGNQFAILLTNEIVVGAGWFLLGVLLMDVIANRGRRDGSVEFM